MFLQAGSHLIGYWYENLQRGTHWAVLWESAHYWTYVMDGVLIQDKMTLKSPS